MSAELVATIDAALAAIDEFERRMSGCITREELDEFGHLAAKVYSLALTEGIATAIPQVSELRPHVESPDIRSPPSFETKLNVPGDWTYTELMAPPQKVFEPCIPSRWYDDMAVLRSLAESSASNGTRSFAHADLALPVPRITVDLAKLQATLDGEQFDVRSEQALRWLKVLASHPGDWISGKELEGYDNSLMEFRSDRVKPKLPKQIQNLIDSETGKGSRIRL